MSGRSSIWKVVGASVLPLVLLLTGLRLTPCECRNEPSTPAVVVSGCPNHPAVTAPTAARAHLTAPCCCEGTVQPDRAPATADSSRDGLTSPTLLAAPVAFAEAPSLLATTALADAARNATGPPVFLRLRTLLL